jgi:hypothetical protein
VTFFLNLFIVAPPVPSWMDRWVYGDFGVAIAYVNIALFAAFTTVLARGVVEHLRSPVVRPVRLEAHDRTVDHGRASSLTAARRG